MLFCFMVKMSQRISSLVMARPRVALNSCRFTPLNTIRLPFNFMIPFSIRNCRIPICCGTTSKTVPSASCKVRTKWYRFGCSALQRSGCSTENATTCSDAVTGMLCSASGLPFGSVSTARSVPDAVPENAQSIRTSACEKVSFKSVWTKRSCRCSFGTAYNSTSRNKPENRQKSWSSSQLPEERWKTCTAILFSPSFK